MVRSNDSLSVFVNCIAGLNILLSGGSVHFFSLKQKGVLGFFECF